MDCAWLIGNRGFHWCSQLSFGGAFVGVSLYPFLWRANLWRCLASALPSPPLAPWVVFLTALVEGFAYIAITSVVHHLLFLSVCLPRDLRFGKTLLGLESIPMHPWSCVGYIWKFHRWLEVLGSSGQPTCIFAMPSSRQDAGFYVAKKEANNAPRGVI